MRITTTGGTLTLGDETMHVEDVAMVGPTYESVEGSEPDPRWSVTDSQGHEHRWMLPLAEKDLQKASIPTAVRSTRHVDCDGSGFHMEAYCEGYDVTEWHCVHCGEEIRPEYRRATFQVKSREGHYELTVQWEPAPVDGEVTWRPSDEARGATARLTWPAGPGQMWDLTGRVWEHGGLHGEQWPGKPVTFRRKFVFVPDVPS